jgi:hypothetical protein
MIFLLVTYLLHVQIQVLDSFLSTIPDFKTYSNSILGLPRYADPADDSLVGHGVGSSRT